MRRPVLAAVALLLAAPVVAGALPTAGAGVGSSAPAVAFADRGLVGPDGAGFPGAEKPLGDADRRGPALAQRASARRALRALGPDLSSSWTQFGTVSSAFRAGGYLERNVAGHGPEQVARTFLGRHADLFGLEVADVAGLELLNADPLPESGIAFVVQLRQRAQGLLVADDGLISVGLRGRDVVIVTSTAVPSDLLATMPAGQRRLSAADAVLAAAADAGVTGLRLADLRVEPTAVQGGFTLVHARGLAQPQHVRMRALGTTDRGMRPVWETNLLHMAGDKALATVTFVDAQSGAVLLRHDAVDTFAEGTGANPAMRTASTALVPPVPPLPSGLVPTVGTTAPLYPATWRAFSSNPQMPNPTVPSKDDRDKICATERSDKSDKAQGCNNWTYFDGSPFAYDVDGVTGLPTFTTVGNNAVTTNAQGSNSLTPGGPLLPPVGPTRDYAPAFTDSWHTSRCDPASIADPTRRADVDAAVVNLFVGHNRIHDFAYLLGLTEKRGALQVVNFGKGGVDSDPELGNTQNAALTHRALAEGGLTGRNNANQSTGADGTPPYTNQYLFQPVVGFYAPCTDGDLDAAIFLHEYTHAISNRLIAGPDTGLSGQQGGSMGESWSDLVALEYLNAFGLAGKRGADPFSMGAYATGDAYRGIRDFNVRDNPLNFSDFGFDVTEAEVHADGEIWNGVQGAIRRAMVDSYRSRYNPNDMALQAACALGRDRNGKKHSTFAGCPGNRRWIQNVFDSMILQAKGSPSFVDMKDAQLAADMMRTGGVDQRTLAIGFARGGLGASSVAASGDIDPTPGFDAPKKFASQNAKVTFQLVDDKTGKPLQGNVYVGTFQARVTPAASTEPKNEDGAKPSATFVNGTYPLVVRVKGYGLQRTTMTVRAGKPMTMRIPLVPNIASAYKGAQLVAKGWVRLRDIVDDDEATNGGFNGAPTKTAIDGQTFTITLAGGKQRVARIAVSAMHRDARTSSNPDTPVDFQGRLLGLHEFEVQASSDRGRTFHTVYRAPERFFPTGPPRAVAPDVQLRTVRLPGNVVADHLRVIVRSNTCTGTKEFSGDHDNDPINNADCTVTDNAYQVVVAEFQAFPR